MSKDNKKLSQINEEKSFKQIVEEVAYNWFNSFAALRFMEIKFYLLSHIRVFYNENNEFTPQIIDEAINLDYNDFQNLDESNRIKTK